MFVIMKHLPSDNGGCRSVEIILTSATVDYLLNQVFQNENGVKAVFLDKK